MPKYVVEVREVRMGRVVVSANHPDEAGELIEEGRFLEDVDWYFEELEVEDVTKAKEKE
jgi:hypothetical protein